MRKNNTIKPQKDKKNKKIKKIKKGGDNWGNLNKKTKNPQLSVATYKQHSKELLLRSIFALAVWLILFIVSYINVKPLMEYLKVEAEKNGFILIYIRVQDVLLQELKLAALIALICALPVILFEITRFVTPIFDNFKAKFLMVVVEIVTILLFATGVVFSYKIILPFVLSYLSSVGTNVEISGTVDVKEFVEFYITILSCMGFVFEIPLCMFTITRTGLVKVEQLKKLRRWVIVLSFLIGAIITPPDVVSQCMVAIPMVLLYEVSLVICSLFKRKTPAIVESQEVCE